MTSPKAGHYEQQLLSAMCRGAWAESEPGKSPKAVGLGWNELLRKYKKHNPDSILATVAVQTQTLALLLARHHPEPPPDSLESTPSRISKKQLDFDGDLEGIDGSLEVGQECKLDSGSRAETDGNFEELRGSKEKGQSSESIRMTEAYYAYARGSVEQCIEIITTVNLDNPVPPERSQTRTSAGSRVHHLPRISVTGISEAITHSGTLAGSAGASALSRRAVDLGPKRVWWTIERVRSRCLEGMSCEVMKNVTAALRAYESGISLLEDLGFKKPDTSSLRSDMFMQYRELWRWAERLLWRAAVVSARISSMQQALQMLRSYHLHSQYWVATFRPFHRSAAYSLYVHALCYSSPLDLETNTIRSSAWMSLSAWTSEAKDALHEYKTILQANTVFPRAGQVNKRVVDFSDLCMAIWEKGGESEDETLWLIDLMWWSTTLTFHSHRILRHLTRLLVAAGDIAEAKRVFHLYVQLVTKARETSAGDVSLQLKRRPTGDPPAPPEEIAFEEGDEDQLGVGRDADGERTFVSALTFGTRMLSRWAENEEDCKEAWKTAELASGILDASNLSGDRILRARLKTAAALARAVEATIEMEPETRPKHQSAAMELLTSSLKLDASADTLYHLAYLQAELRDIDAAVLSAKQAVEKEPRDVSAWHLLGLLLTAQGDYHGALAVLKLGLEEVSVQQELDRAKETAGNPSLPQLEGVSSKDFGISDGTKSKRTSTGGPVGQSTEAPVESSSPQPALLISETIPLGYTLHKPLFNIKPTKTHRFEVALQLLITRNTIVELLEGPESANSNWVDIFAYFSEQCPIPLYGNSRRHSSETTTSTPIMLPSEPVRPVETLSTVQEVSGMQIPQVVTHAPPDSPTQESNGTTPRHSAEQAKGLQPRPLQHKGSHRGGRPFGKDEKRVNLDELRMKSQKLLLGGQKQLQTLSRKIIHRDGHNGARIPRSRSVPDFHPPLSASVYQASSIHSRVRRYPSPGSLRAGMSPTRLEPPTPSIVPSEPSGHTGRTQHETRILSDLWLMSAATFRRMGQIEQAHGAIQEAEVIDPENPNVWVQLGLYFAAMENPRLAVESFHKALVIDPDNVAGSVHLAQQYLAGDGADLAAGLLMSVTQGSGWDVAEAWYYLAKACEKLGRRERERECLVYALQLEESKPIRSLNKAVPRRL